MAARQTPEQAARFERFRSALLVDIRSNAYRAALAAGYTVRMAKSKSYLLARRAWKERKFRRCSYALHIAPIVKRQKEREAAEDQAFEMYLISLRK